MGRLFYSEMREDGGMGAVMLDGHGKRHVHIWILSVESFLRITEVFGLWKIINPYFQEKP